MNVLVTGGRGFLGRGIVARLVEQGHHVRVLDNSFRRTGELDVAAAEIIDGDIRDLGLVRAAVEGTDVVFHLAAIQGTRNFYEMPEQVLDVNLTGTLNVASACANAGVKRLLFSSSSEVYGVPRVFPTPETEPLVVPDPLNARWSYGGSKVVGELIVVNAARMNGFDFTIVRYHNVYGPGMGWDHVLPEFIRRLELGEEFTIQGDGEQRRSFCYVDDAVDATIVAMFHTAGANEIFNIGNPSEERSINEIVRDLSDISGRDISPRHVPFPGEGTRRRLPDTSKIERLLGVRPSIDFKVGLHQTYDWYSTILSEEKEL
jgi:nucleoside-diphosphate-sugar epimerase